jgi:hypothetical protein
MGRTDQELQHASEHVKYEIEMLAATTSFFSKSPGGTDQAAWNAYLESFVLHVRNLIDFYYPPERRKGLILAQDYSDVTKWNGSLPAMTPLLKEPKSRVNKLAGHLTYKRPVSDKNWKWSAISAGLDQVFICFLNHLPPDRKAWFAGAELTGPTGTPSPAGGAGATGPIGPASSGEATTRE